MDRFNKPLTSDKVSAGQADKKYETEEQHQTMTGGVGMNEIKIFENTEFGSVRTVDIEGKTYFVASDVAKSLGYARPQNAIAAHCKGALKRGIGVQTGNRADGTPAMQMIEMSVIPEGDIYRLIIKSQLPTADKFEQWIFDEVIPSIRKNGGYISGQETMSDDELLAKAFVVAQNKIAERDKAINQLKTEVDVKNQLIGELNPKADYTDLILNNKGLVTITQIAKDYGMSGQEMNELLHGLGVQYKQSGQWLLYKDYHDKGYTHSVTVNFTRSDGRPDIKMNTKWTQKGRLFMYNLLKDSGYLPLIEKESA